MEIYSQQNFSLHKASIVTEWRDKFLCYKPLKKLLKNFPNTTIVDSIPQDPTFPSDQRLPFANTTIEPADSRDGPGTIGNRPSVDLQDWFVRILNEELEKFNDFYIDKEEEFVIRLQELKERIERVKERSGRGGVLTSESEFSEEMMDIRRDFVTIHGEMVLLENYSSLNFAGLVKILKKYDKRTGELLRLPFTQLALHQPFFATEPLTRLVRQCESNLELLFPLEGEVIESASASQDQSNTPQKNAPKISPASTLGEETLDIYRSTLAAMRAIRGLQKESSTHNPLSFSSLVRSRDDDSVGTVTAENSVSNSSATSQSGEADQDDVHST